MQWWGENNSGRIKTLSSKEVKRGHIQYRRKEKKKRKEEKPK